MIPSVEEITEQGPRQILEWIMMARSNRYVVSDDTNWWLRLANIANFHAITNDRDTISDQERLYWAYTAIEVYNYLVENVAPEGRNSFECSAMFLRASMIERAGVMPGHIVLDPYIVQKWFFDRLDLTRESVANEAMSWRDLPLAHIRKLRHLKNRLSVIDFFVTKRYIQDHELTEWLKLRAVLP